MIRKSLLIMALALTYAMTPAVARHLSAEEALLRAKSDISVAKAPGIAANPVLTTIISDRQDNDAAYYVYSGSNGRGFMVLPADDAQVPVVGYSDTGVFDGDNIPPALACWLDAYAVSAKHQPIFKEALTSRDSDDDRAPIAPIVKTQWNQDYPYNQACPLIKGKRPYTGCVATAMAQIMNVHQWPESGVGFRKYTFAYEGVEYSDSLDFASTVFDWDNMSNTYAGYSTSVQKEAVATLMHACGVASLMNYGLDQSGANDLNAAQGMIRYLNYDKGMKWVQHSWYTDNEWTDAIYAELAQGRPVLLSGLDWYGNGHEFICDGYSKDNDFHINWGWGGLSDGYYYIFELQPADQGIGASTGSYDYGQAMLMNIRPAQEGSMYAPVLYAEDFSVPDSGYPRNAQQLISFDGPVYSGALTTIRYILGLQLTDANGNKRYVEYGPAEFAPNAGFGRASFNTMNIPVGSWDVCFAFKTEYTDWQPVYYNHNTTSNKLHLTVTSDWIQVGDDSVHFTGQYDGWTPANETDSTLCAGNTYNFRFTVTSSASWSGDMYCLLHNGSSVLTKSAPVNLEFNGLQAISDVWTMTFEKSLEKGSYYLSLATRSGNTYNLITSDIIEITEGEVPPGKASFSWTQPEGAKYYPSRSYDFTLDVTTTGWWSGKRSLALLMNEGGKWYLVNRGELRELNYPEAGTYHETWNIETGNINAGTYYLAILNENSQFYDSETWTVYINQGPAPIILTAEYLGWISEDVEDKALYPGHNYEFDYTFSSDAAWNGRVFCTISNDQTEYVSDKINVTFYKSSSEDVTFPMTIDDNCEPGSYTLSFVAQANGEDQVIDTQTITIAELDGIISAINDAADAKYYNLQGMPVAHPTNGNIYIRQQGDKATKVIIND